MTDITELQRRYEWELHTVRAAHYQRTPGCPALPHLVYDRLTGREREHAKGCAYCQKMLRFATSARESCLDKLTRRLKETSWPWARLGLRTTTATEPLVGEEKAQCLSAPALAIWRVPVGRREDMISYPRWRRLRAQAHPWLIKLESCLGLLGHAPSAPTVSEGTQEAAHTREDKGRNSWWRSTLTFLGGPDPATRLFYIAPVGLLLVGSLVVILAVALPTLWPDPKGPGAVLHGLPVSII